MQKQCVRWKHYKAKNVRGSDFLSSFPDILEKTHRGYLVHRILGMERKTPISFERASRMTEEKYLEAIDNWRFGRRPGECRWYLDNFIEWIADQGFHIELTGDEFEPC